MMKFGEKKFSSLGSIHTFLEFFHICPFLILSGWNVFNVQMFWVNVRKEERSSILLFTQKSGIKTEGILEQFHPIFCYWERPLKSLWFAGTSFGRLGKFVNKFGYHHAAIQKENLRHLSSSCGKCRAENSQLKDRLRFHAYIFGPILLLIVYWDKSSSFGLGDSWNLHRDKHKYLYGIHEGLLGV